MQAGHPLGGRRGLTGKQALFDNAEERGGEGDPDSGLFAGDNLGRTWSSGAALPKSSKIQPASTEVPMTSASSSSNQRPYKIHAVFQNVSHLVDRERSILEAAVSVAVKQLSELVQVRHVHW